MRICWVSADTHFSLRKSRHLFSLECGRAVLGFRHADEEEETDS